MPVDFRPELAPFLAEFAEHHRGVRLGKMFGVPAIYVGRKLACCVMDKGILVRLPEDVAKQEVRAKRGEHFSRREKKVLGRWVMYAPRSAVAARKLTPTIELAVRNIAERITEEITGIALEPAKAGPHARQRRAAPTPRRRPRP